MQLCVGVEIGDGALAIAVIEGSYIDLTISTFSSDIAYSGSPAASTAWARSVKIQTSMPFPSRA